MARTLINSYTFNPIARTITINGQGASLSKYGLTSVRNRTTGETYYTQNLVNQISVTGSTFTLPAGVIVTPAKASDDLLIFFDPAVVASHVDGEGKDVVSSVLSNLPWIDGPVDFDTLISPGIYMIAGSFLNGDPTTYHQPGNTGNIKLTVSVFPRPVGDPAAPAVIMQEYKSLDAADKGGQRRRYGTWNGWAKY